jgi:high-affinity nickel-transport protein
LQAFRKIVKKNWFPYSVVVLLLHIVGFSLLAIGAKNHPLLLGMAFISYTLGLRHAFDADHIAAIDNTFRKLVQQKKKAVGVGFFFSLVHSRALRSRELLNLI